MSRGRVFFDVAVSLDGLIAPEGMDLADASEPDYKQWASQWAKLQGQYPATRSSLLSDTAKALTRKRLDGPIHYLGT